MILYARLGLGDQFFCASDSHFLKVGMFGVCVFMIGIGFLLAGMLLERKE